jgi:hypothetical protein
MLRWGACKGGCVAECCGGGVSEGDRLLFAAVGSGDGGCAAKFLVLLSDCKRESGSERGWHAGAHPTPTLGFFERFQPKGAYSKHCDPLWRQAQLTDAIRPSSTAVVEKYYVVHLAFCLMQ